MKTSPLKPPGYDNTAIINKKNDDMDKKLKINNLFISIIKNEDGKRIGLTNLMMKLAEKDFDDKIIYESSGKYDLLSYLESDKNFVLSRDLKNQIIISIPSSSTSSPNTSSSGPTFFNNPPPNHNIDKGPSTFLFGNHVKGSNSSSSTILNGIGYSPDMAAVSLFNTSSNTLLFDNNKVASKPPSLYDNYSSAFGYPSKFEASNTAEEYQSQQFQRILGSNTIAERDSIISPASLSSSTLLWPSSVGSAFGPVLPTEKTELETRNYDLKYGLAAFKETKEDIVEPPITAPVVVNTATRVATTTIPPTSTSGLTHPSFKSALTADSSGVTNTSNANKTVVEKEKEISKKPPVIDESTITPQFMLEALTEHIRKEPEGVFLSTCGDILSSKVGIPPPLARKLTGNISLLQWMSLQDCFHVWEVKRDVESSKPPIYKVSIKGKGEDSVVQKFRNILKQQLESNPDKTIYLSNVGVYFGQVSGISTEELKKEANCATLISIISKFPEIVMNTTSKGHCKVSLKRDSTLLPSTTTTPPTPTPATAITTTTVSPLPIEKVIVAEKPVIIEAKAVKVNSLKKAEIMEESKHVEKNNKSSNSENVLAAEATALKNDPKFKGIIKVIHSVLCDAKGEYIDLAVVGIKYQQMSGISLRDATNGVKLTRLLEGTPNYHFKKTGTSTLVAFKVSKTKNADEEVDEETSPSKKEKESKLKDKEKEKLPTPLSPCKYTLAGEKCPIGPKCKFSHRLEESETSPSKSSDAICKYFAMTGKCKYKSTCHFQHIRLKEKKSEYDSDGEYPDKKMDKSVCKYFASKGKCPFKDKCHFLHNNVASLSPPTSV